MKKIIPLLTAALVSCILLSAQKFDRELVSFQNTHIPSKLIYDQIKTYGVNIIANNSVQFSLDNNLANNLVVNFTSYSRVDFATADLKVYATYGPYIFAEERTATETKDEKVDSVTKKVTYYKRVLYFKYPIAYKVVNSRNNMVIYNNEFSSGNVRTVESTQFRTEAEAIKNLNDTRNVLITAHINELCNNFMNPSTSSIRDMFDFYPAQNSLDIYRIKKWDKDDEYNAHVKNVVAAFKVQLATDEPATVKEKIKDDLAYFQGFEGIFNPADKKEDILYFCKYYNLATIFYCLDDLEKASYYIQKLDSSNKQERNTAYFKSLINIATVRTTKHFLNTTHLNYNPVKDYRLAGKEFKSDAGEAPAGTVAAGSTTPVVQKEYDQTKDKQKLLKYIGLAYQCWNTGSNTVYIEPAEYIYKAGTNEITGQKFLYPVNNKKFDYINLNIVNTTIPSAVFGEYMNNFKVALTWKEEKLTGIKIDGLSEFDYILNYEKDSVLTGFTSRNLFNGNITTVLKMEFSNDRIAKITKYENQTGNSPWIRSIKTFTYKETETVVDCLTYGTNKPNTPKNIVSTLQGIYKKSSTNPYIVVQPYNETTEISYNANDDAEKMIVRKRNTVEEHSYIYEGNKLFKETTIVKNLDGSFAEKVIGIAFSSAKAGSAAPVYETTQGTYKFNQNDEMIYEARDSKYRTKENGVWSDWKNFRY